jgi:hypothetical protein
VGRWTYLRGGGSAPHPVATRRREVGFHSGRVMEPESGDVEDSEAEAGIIDCNRSL